MNIQEQIALMLSDLNDESSDLYTLVFLRSGMSRDDFARELSDNIRTANELTFYGGYDTVYCGYTFIDGRQVYFKFSAPKKEMQAAVGSGAPFLEMYRGGVFLIELSPTILLKYVMPFYYKEFATFSKAYAQHPLVKEWKNFYVSED